MHVETMALGRRERQPRTLRIFGIELNNELMKLLRTPGFVLPALGFPWVFYLFFAIVMPSNGGPKVAGYLLATYGVFAVLGVSLFALGANVAIGRGWTTARRAMPASGPLNIAARIVVAMVLGGISVLGLLVLAALAGGVRLETGSWFALFGVQVAFAVPFGALGLAIGQLLSADAAPGVTNLIYLPMSFLSGLWIPVTMLPKLVQQFAPTLPPFHAGRLALWVVGHEPGGIPWSSIGYLLVLTAAAFVAAAWAMRRQGGAK